MCRARLAAEPQRYPYYPGSDKRFDAFRASFPQAEELGQAQGGGQGGQVPFLLVAGLSPEQVCNQPSRNAPVILRRKWPLNGQDTLPGRLSVEHERKCRLQANTTRENWCGCLQEVCLPGTGVDSAAFLEKAVAFANDKCWCATVAPASARLVLQTHEGRLSVPGELCPAPCLCRQMYSGSSQQPWTKP